VCTQRGKRLRLCTKLGGKPINSNNGQIGGTGVESAQNYCLARVSTIDATTTTSAVTTTAA
jgi:hypothetical protein